ncbi:tRNA (5-methylaminomethyl-2-thiouridine)(34)-methyltransferase MnmD [Roseovarius atlanticus]|uniref:tRNA (5-methylaminomethyl-2-thiouridine)(34)-methyltransferase MnmD n=1 Tax=Roseovarius atlanticus TaxID=1641875 RepID=UPI001C9619B9|nr:tRNA (5-methylaminomethyl-2-thiouridine)(34)-methyltransferase MnmD [Roseovarius atlanticus]MBY5989671.1 tRNA (5-methylaminomethyl-2-thiouridine)(34)-methyltransferase MnmD [Roseovarius atlanticus]MBY6126216.1 tRNA (5-methylaminomethyl-2-thiouridine)(34)-methyltransferase MnmD [Roseovarius atlanticus]MBY6150710.1 tRNA (5-methylaminomethyl-2-thiouridine)(34)-methyltransferase MnmD [Roseovarius atlanticus]
MQDQQAELEWREGDVPVSTRFDDPYFSLENGLAETRHVFLGGNDLPARFREGFHVAELGFGTGLNFLTALQAWRAAGVPGTLHFTSFEAFPMEPAQIARALSVFSDLPIEALELERGGPFGHPLAGPDFRLRIIEGDARATLPGWDGAADAWFLDGFSPAKNPELWEEALMRHVGQHTAPGGTAATYTAAGFVRRGLQAAGFEVDRVPGYGRKRHMTRARKT